MKITVAKKLADKNYTSIDKYKPTGNLIYNSEILKTIQDKTIKLNIEKLN